MTVTVSAIKKTEYQATVNMVEASFWEYDASYYNKQGQDSFLAYANFANFAYRQWHHHITFVAKDGNRIIGMIELRTENHISMLFVAPGEVKKGIGKELVSCALQYIAEHNPKTTYVTVNSSLYAVEFYKHIGFEATDSRHDNDGLIVIPMAIRIDKDCKLL